MPWKWKQTLNTDKVSVWEHGDYQIVGTGRMYGRKLVRDWKVRRLDVLIGDKIARLSEAKRDAESHQELIETDVVTLVGKIQRDEKFLIAEIVGNEAWLLTVRNWAISNKIIELHGESHGYPLELKVTDTGRAWYAERVQ